MSENMIQRLLSYIRINFFKDGDFIEKEKTEVLQVNFQMMRLLRMSPQKGKAYTYKDILVLCVIMSPCIWIDCVANIIKQLFYSEQFLGLDVLDNTSIILSSTNMYMMVIMFVHKNQDIIKLSERIGYFRQFQKPINFDRVNFIANMIALICFAYTIFATWIYMFVNYLQRDLCLKENEMLNIERVCGLVAPSALPSYFNNYYYILVFLQSIIAAVGTTTTSVVYMFIFGSALLITSRVHHLREEIRSAFNTNNTALQKERLKNCVRYHVFLIDTVNHLNRCISWPCFLQSSYTCIAIAVIGVQMMLQPGLKYFLHCFGWAVFAFLSSVGGQILLNETNLIPMYIYDTDWFECHVETQKSVILIIQQGNQDVYIDTKLFGPMGMNTFVMIMKNAYTVLAMVYNEMLQ